MQKKYTKWEVAGLLPLFLTSFLGGYLFFVVLSWVSRYLAPKSSGSRWLMLPDESFFMLPAIFVGIVAGTVATALLYRFLLGRDRYAEFVLYGELKLGFDSRRVAIFFFAIVLIPSILVSYLAIDCYAQFTDDKMIINAFWGVGERSHVYSDITKIDSISRLKAPNGNIVERQHYQIHFKDGYVWSSRDTLYRLDPDQKVNSEKEKEVIQFVANKSGKQIETHDLPPEDN